MATDGTGIVDGDLAADFYTHFMNSFHEGASTKQLYGQFLDFKSEFAVDTPECEICVTVHALAFWEIGALSADLLAEVKATIEQKATVAHFTKEVGKEAGDARKKELDDFLKKISVPNRKPTKRRKRQPKPNIFDVGDVLSFQYPDQTYGTAFVVDISKMSGLSFYSVCRTVGALEKPGSMVEFLRSKFHASEVPSRDASGEPTTQLSVWVHEIERNDLEKFSACFAKIGKVNFALECGQSLISKDFQKFCDHVTYEQQVAYYREKIGAHVDQYAVDAFATAVPF